MNLYRQSRQKFQERIEKGLLGPCSDIFVPEEAKAEEIISDPPLIRYYTGILFPDRQRPNTQDDADHNRLKSEEPESGKEYGEEPEKHEEEVFQDEKPDRNEDENHYRQSIQEDFVLSQNSFFPTNCGLTFCVVKNTPSVKVDFEFGIYDPLEYDIRIAIDKKVFKLFMEHPTFPFKNLLRYEDGYLILERKLDGRARSPREGEYVDYDEFRFSDELKESELNNYFRFFSKLIGRTWIRTPKKISKTIPLREGANDEIFRREISPSHFQSVSFRVKTYETDRHPGRVFVKIQIINTSNEHPDRRFSNKNEELNRKCVFQTKITVHSDSLQPYRSYQEINPTDEEQNRLNYLYRQINSYGIGHNCSFEWAKSEEDEHPNWVAISWLPKYDVRDTKNRFEEEDFADHQTFEQLNQCLDIYDLSIFSPLDQCQVIDRMRRFVMTYDSWFEREKQKQIGGDYSEVEKNLLKNIGYNLQRLLENLSCLSDPKIFRAFQLANTAMLLQLILSNDPAFGGNEKNLPELENYLGEIDYNNLDFFHNYPFGKGDRFIRPKYRPFQLAFLLLNLNSITDLNSTNRKEVVDLLWFPTGGGKTEAYLAVAALTIIWRRMQYPHRSDGTSVIMRYTLRLLAAQQFERASRLIAALEFLRCHYQNELGNSSITIGLWVGMASTPNRTEDARSIVQEINRDANSNRRNYQSDPEQKNKFQVSACPWCGTKLISRNQTDDGWLIGFESRPFHIRCLNNACHFHTEIPVQVVDEKLYGHPPTLLFGTVDKFAMLAWEPEGHRFFNTQNDNLPPDLIIQDELHLLSGPLGSITGIFESVIEDFCTKGDYQPKIIASTATTRNTDQQVAALYGNRRVNIFPPSGLTYRDSFFAKSSQSSRRQYLGFMPTGKTAIETQLHILAHLLYARLEIFLEAREVNDFERMDKYWTLVSYYNSLKDVGRINNKIGDEVKDYTSTLQNRLLGYNRQLAFNYFLEARKVELTGRIPSPRIKQVLKRLEEWHFTAENLQPASSGYVYLKNVVDLVLATNMISVGIDIERLNLMLINGQPRNVAEYIQASSRVGRNHPGLVVSLLDANRSRDKSHFEHFVPFHQAFYKSVEPLSVTPFTESTLEKMLATLAVAYVRLHFPETSPQNAANQFQPEMLDGLRQLLKERFEGKAYEIERCEAMLDQISEAWEQKTNGLSLRHYKRQNIWNDVLTGILRRPSEAIGNLDDPLVVMQSMREVDTDSFVKIDLP